MLSGAKHPQYPLENSQMQILRAVYPERSERAQDDNRGDSFRSLPVTGQAPAMIYALIARHSGSNKP